MTIRDYEIICAVYEEKSISQAAVKLGIAQPTVSNVLRALEKKLGVELFHRSVAGCFPSEKGQHLYDAAKAILNLNRHVEAELGFSSTRDALHVGFYSAFGEGPLADFLDFLSKNTRLVVKPTIDNYSAIHSKLKMGLLDLALTDFYFYDHNISAVPIMRDKMILVAASNFPCKTSMTFEEFAKLPLIVREAGSGDYRTIARCFQNQHYPFEPWGIASSNASLFSMVRRGYGITCCSKVYFQRDVDKLGLKEIEITGVNLEKEVYILLPQNPKPAVASQRLVRHIMEYLESIEIDRLVQLLPWPSK